LLLLLLLLLLLPLLLPSRPVAGRGRCIFSQPGESAGYWIGWRNWRRHPGNWPYRPGRPLNWFGALGDAHSVVQKKNQESRIQGADCALYVAKRGVLPYVNFDAAQAKDMELLSWVK
jgi:hypothetical protein